MAIGIGLIGMGVVGGGVARILCDRERELKTVRGLDFDIRKIAIRDPSKPRAIDIALDRFTTDPHGRGHGPHHPNRNRSHRRG